MEWRIKPTHEQMDWRTRKWTGGTFLGIYDAKLKVEPSIISINFNETTNTNAEQWKTLKVNSLIPFSTAIILAVSSYASLKIKLENKLPRQIHSHAKCLDHPFSVHLKFHLLFPLNHSGLGRPVVGFSVAHLKFHLVFPLIRSGFGLPVCRFFSRPSEISSAIFSHS